MSRKRRTISLDAEQLRFLALHTSAAVVEWRWLFRGGSFRAKALDGSSVTLSATDLNEMVQAGLVEMPGDCYVRVTPAGEVFAKAAA